MLQYGEPDFYAGHFREITPEVLQDFGVKCVLTDLDETLVGQGAEDPTPEVFAWFDRLKKAGIPVCIVSNNSHARAARFAQKTGIRFFLSRARKPWTFRVRRALCAMNCKPEESAFVGDQVHTDMGVARKLGMKAFLVDPVRGKKRHFFVELRRNLWENAIRARFRKGKKHDKSGKITEKTETN